MKSKSAKSKKSKRANSQPCRILIKIKHGIQIRIKSLRSATLFVTQAANLQCIPTPGDSCLKGLLEAPMKVARSHVLPHKELLVPVGLNVGPAIEKILKIH